MNNELKSVSASIVINAPKSTVWAVWATFHNVADYCAGIPKSYTIGDIEYGLGMQRRCDLSKSMQVDERIIDWKEGESYAMEVTRAEGTPIKILQVSFQLTSMPSGTKVTISIAYRMKGLMNYIPMKSLFRLQAKDHIMGLKYHIEQEQRVEPNMLKKIRNMYKQQLCDK